MAKKFHLFGRNQSPPRPESSTNEPCVKEFKILVEEVRKEQPDLSEGAIHQISLERFTKRMERMRLEDNAKRTSSESNVLSSVFSKFRLGASLPEAPLWHSTSSLIDPIDMQGRRRSIAPRKSVTIDEMEVNGEVQPVNLGRIASRTNRGLRKNDSCTSLQKSLNIIEEAFNISKEFTRPRSSSLSSESFEPQEVDKLASVDFNVSISSSDISDSQEYLVELDHNHSSSTRDNSQCNRDSIRSPSKESNSFALSHEEDVEGEAFTGDFTAWRKPYMSDRSRRRSSAFDSVRSSMSSIDEENFKGDFSAWKSPSRCLS